MTQFLLLAAASPESTGVIQEVSRTFHLDWPHFLASAVSFSFVAFVLQRFVYKPILQMLEERKTRIAESMANAEKIKAELARTEASRREVLDQANQQALRLIEEARAAAARVQEVETQKAIAAAEQIITKAREAAVADHARMMGELRREVGRLAVQTAALVTGKILTVEDQKRLVEEANRDLAA